MDFVTTLPNNISKQILAGLEYTKKKMPTDLVATTVGVTGPQVTPPGSPIDGQVAKSAGAPVEKYITLTIDTSEFDILLHLEKEPVNDLPTMEVALAELEKAAEAVWPAEERFKRF